MDILDLLITILIIGGSIFLSIRKKNNQATSAEPPHEDENPEWNSEWDTEVEEHNWEAILQKTSKNNLNPQFYDDLEKIDTREKNIIKEEIIYTQNIELEKETDELFSISRDDMRKAVIYSEILKSPCFE